MSSLEKTTILKSTLDVYMDKISVAQTNSKILYNFTSGWQHEAASPADYSGIVFNYLYTSGEHFYNNIVDVDLLGSGEGYSSPPTIIFSDPNGMGSGASGVGLLGGDKITGVNMISGGQNYTIDPLVTFSGGGYSELASGTAVLTPEIFRSDVYPAIGYISNPNVVNPPSSGYFNEKDGLFIPEKINYDDFLLVIDYEEPNSFYNPVGDPGLGAVSPVNLENARIIATSTTSKEDPSGCIVGINGANKLFFEYTSKNNLRKVFTLDTEMSSKNLIAINKAEGSVKLNYFDYINNKIYSEDFTLLDESNAVDYTPGEWWTIGQWNRTGVFEEFWYGTGNVRLPNIDGYQGFSGHIDSVLLISGNVTHDENLKTLSELFFLTGLETNRYSDETVYYPLPTGVQEEIVTSGSGVIGSYMADFEIVDYSGRIIKIRDNRPESGMIYNTESVYQTGVTSGSYVERTYLPDQYSFDDGNIKKHGKNGILMKDRSGDTMFPAHSSGTDQVEVYNSRVKNASNLSIYGSFLYSEGGSGYISFDNDSEKATAQNVTQTEDFVNGFTVYKNGLLQSSGLHYSVENLGTNSPMIVGLGYELGDVFRCDNITGAQFYSGIENVSPWNNSISTNDPILFSGSQYSGKDLYLNGLKIMSGQGYYYSGSFLAIKTDEINSKSWHTPVVGGNLAFVPAYEKYYQILGEGHWSSESAGFGPEVNDSYAALTNWTVFPFFRFSESTSHLSGDLINLINEKVWEKGKLLEHGKDYLRLYHDSINSGSFEMAPKSGKIMNLYN